MISLVSTGQSYKVTYNKEIHFNFLNKTLKKNGDTDKDTKNNIINDLNKGSNNSSYTLQFNDSISKFKLNPELTADNESTLYTLGKTLFTNGLYYIDKKNNLAYNINESYGENFRIVLDDKEWEITKEKTTINGFVCFKAKTIDYVYRSDSKYEMPVIAWFCPELPAYFGPTSYRGLPGLILKVENKNMTLTAIKVEKMKTFKIISIPKKGSLVSEKEFNQISTDASKAYGFKKN